MGQSEHMLTETQEKLLMRAHDGECGVCGRFMVRRLLRRSETARQFASELEAVQESVRDLSNSSTADLTGLWDRIETRIEQEERAALFLGKRSAVSAPVRATTPIWQWGFAGAAATACVSLLVVQSPQNQQPVAPDRVAGAAVESPQVRLSAQTHQSDIPRVLGGPDHAVEVDWVRSDGQVRFIPDSRQRSALIWVKKRTPSNRYSRPSGGSPQYLGIVPTVGLSAPSSSDDAIVVERAIPNSIPAVNR